METSYSEEQESFRASLRRFLEDKGGTGFTREQWSQSSPLSGAGWEQLSELGVTGLLVPESAGGIGGDMVDMGVVMEELGRQVQPGPAWSSCVGATTAAADFAQDKLLAELAGGARRATLAVAEPGRSFALWQDPQVRADGDRLHGLKTEVPDALDADAFFVTTDGGVYLVDAGAAGLRIDAEETVDGSRRFAAVSFAGTPGTRLGDNGELAHAVDRMLVALCADGVGAAQRALELTIEYAAERRQFGQPIGSFQAVQHLCADMLQALELGRAGLHYALWAVDAGDAAEAHRSAVMCKAYMADTFAQIGAGAIQVFGGAGFTWEYDIQLYYKRLLSLELTWGNAAVWLEELARLVIDGEAPAIIPE